jgi:hypothetical protein
MNQPRLRPVAALSSLLAIVAVAGAQSGFQDGELILYSPAVQGTGPSGGAIVRIDPVTGSASELLDLAGTQSLNDSIAYDPFRQRLIFYAGIPTANDPARIHFVDGFGSTTDLGNEGVQAHAFAPASGGRIYFATQSTNQVHYFDANDVQHFLMDASGTQPYSPPQSVFASMHYDAGLNALFAAVSAGSIWNCGAPSPNSTVIRIDLSADGTQLTGTTDCTELIVDPGSSNDPVGLSTGPNGDLLVVVDTNSLQGHPRMQVVDPATMMASPLAWNDHLSSAATNAGTWSSILNRAVILDTGSDVLRSFGVGETGAGTTIIPSIQISSGGSSGEVATLIEVRPGGCASGAAVYCVPKVTFDGCIPSISTSGSPSASAGSGFIIEATQVNPNQIGIFFYGLNGAAAIPLFGATLCAQPPLIRAPFVTATGAGMCGGVLTMDFNAYLASTAPAQVTAGSVVHGQYWFRDPQHPIAGIGFTDAVTFTICP